MDFGYAVRGRNIFMVDGSDKLKRIHHKHWNAGTGPERV